MEKHWKKFVALAFSILLLGTFLASCKEDTSSLQGVTPASQSTVKGSTMKNTELKKIVLTEEEWRDKLSPQEYYVTREKGTEKAFTGEYWDSKSPGVYTCVACGENLFESNTKFNSGTGWPSFWEPIHENSVTTIEDSSLGMARVEVVCSKCNSHLGHVFEDGPEPTGKRYCINSVSLKLVSQEETER